jgi:hypothetical protein
VKPRRQSSRPRLPQKDELLLHDMDHGFWFDWVFARVLFREAAELLPAKSAFTQGGAL